jgi:hypothetical protein
MNVHIVRPRNDAGRRATNWRFSAGQVTAKTMPVMLAWFETSPEVSSLRSRSSAVLNADYYWVEYRYG